VMVIAEKWAEQRVLMRAYAESRDQLRPTIMLHGTELAIGPAGLDLNGPWGIHVGENPDGRAQDIKLQLEATARRLAGSKGNPPRLADEEPTFDRELGAVQHDRRPQLIPALGVRTHQHALLRPFLGDHHHGPIVARARRWTPQPVIDDPDLRHALPHCTAIPRSLAGLQSCETSFDQRPARSRPPHAASLPSS